MKYHLSNTTPRAVNNGIFGQEPPPNGGEKAETKLRVGLSVAFTVLAVGWVWSATADVPGFQAMYRTVRK